MKLIYKIFNILILFSIISCAKQSTPMGGLKDEKAPVLIGINPEDQSTQIKPKTIELIFDEYVKLENANKQIIITPKINKDELITTVNKNKVILKLNQELEDNTTYVFNFQKSIKDITEGNPAENLKLVFSTGESIDSLKVSGQVNHTFLQRDEMMKDVLVGLYTLEDSMNVLTAQPYYITQTDSIGKFTLENIKPGKYKIYSWKDLNNSLKAEEKSEPYAFLTDTLDIDSNIEGIQMYLTKADLTPFRINRAGSTASYFDVSLNKYPVSISIEHAELNKKLFYRKNEQIIRFYHTELKSDSTQVKLSLLDSVGFKIDTTLYAKFLPSDRPKEKLETLIIANKNFYQKVEVDFKFNKPIQQINYDSLYISYDTISKIAITPQLIYLKDSSNYTNLSLLYYLSDSVTKDNYKLYAGIKTFTDIENISNEKAIEYSFKKLKEETLVTALKGKVKTDDNPLIIQLLKKDEIIREIYLEKGNLFEFRNIEAGTYQIRIIHDSNKNKRWDTSNLKRNHYQEKVYYHINNNSENKYDIILKAGWENEIEINPIPEQGINTKNILENTGENGVDN